ncbi:MAG: Malonyl CoA-acyl carrier protein transacylase [Candidatus Anoxychlamydiales bacterium]|nr:Malonyl CoA-acyl carrier protein transacylase [Candidatus Anoxychlamydiales bacterium]
MKKIAFIFPGQGSQKVGMGKDFYDNFVTSKKIYDQADELLGYKLTDIMFNGPFEKLSLTKNSQLAIFVNSIAILSALNEMYPDLKPTICAGLSLGEYSAIYAAQKLGIKELIFLIQKRASLMDEACKKNEGAMAAVLKMKKEDIEDTIQEFEDLWIANLNTADQTVISGKKSSIEKAQKILLEKGAKRVVILDVQGAFHTPYMKFAEDSLKDEILKTNFLDSSISFIMNVTATRVQDTSYLKTNLIKQVSSTILWEGSIKAIDSEVDLFIEIGSKTLTGMNKKIGIKALSLAVEKVQDLEELKNAIEK